MAWRSVSLSSAFMISFLPACPHRQHAGLPRSFYDFLTVRTKECAISQVHGGVESPRGGDN